MIENPNFRPGHRFSILGIEMADPSRWLRWGLPFASGIVAGAAISLVFALVG